MGWRRFGRTFWGWQFFFAEANLHFVVDICLFLELFLNLLYFRVRKWSYLESNMEEGKLEVRKCSSARSSPDLHGKDSMWKALISYSAINIDDSSRICIINLAR